MIPSMELSAQSVNGAGNTVRPGRRPTYGQDHRILGRLTEHHRSRSAPNRTFTPDGWGQGQPCSLAQACCRWRAERSTAVLVKWQAFPIGCRGSSGILWSARSVWVACCRYSCQGCQEWVLVG